MSNLEKKIDLLLRVVAAENESARNEALDEARAICKEPDTEEVEGNSIVRQIVENLLIEIGISTSLKGFYALKEAIVIAVENPDVLRRHVTKGLYPEVAKRLGSGNNCARVERAMRHAVELWFDRADYDVINHYFGSAYSREKGKATNTEFISRMAIEVSRRM